MSPRAKAIALAVFGAAVFGAGLGGLLAALPGCSTPAAKHWTQKDTDRALAQKNASMQLEQICSRDGGPCPAGPVRSIEMSMCFNAASALYDHGQGPADAGCP